MPDDIFEVKPKLYGVGINFNEVWRRLRQKKVKSGPVDIVAERFVELFKSHGIPVAQIPKWEPAITLSSLSTTEKLIASLTPEILDRVADFFGVQRSWLEGSTDRIYRTYTCYKNPAGFFDQLGRVKNEQRFFTVRVLTSATNLDFEDSSVQPLGLVLVEKIAEVDDIDQMWGIDRYHVFGDAWDWGHIPCRIQLKAMARVIDQVLKTPVPLFRASAAEIEAVQDGRLIPRKLVNHCLLTEPSLEDYGESLDEHPRAKETRELPAVLKYVADFGLETLARSLVPK